jgi:hypothetical protein
VGAVVSANVPQIPASVIIGCSGGDTQKNYWWSALAETHRAEKPHQFRFGSALIWLSRYRADVAERELQRRFAPQIEVFLDPDNYGVAENPTETVAPSRLRGPSSKWVQFSVRCATDAPLIDCEAWLTSVRKIDGGVVGRELVDEHIHCHWSQRERGEKKITLAPVLIQRANLFAFYNNPTALVIVPQTDPLKIRLRDAIQQPGSYRAEVLVTAQGAPSLAATFVFEWHSFNDVTLRQTEGSQIGY